MTAFSFRTFILACLALVATEIHEFGVGGKPILCVSNGDMDPALLPYADESTHLKPGAGRTPGFGFLFDSAAVQSIIKGWHIKQEFSGHPYVNAISGTVSFVGHDDGLRFGPAMRARSTEDEWYSRGQCPNAVFRKLVGTEFFEVKCRKGDDYGSIWNREPNTQSSLPDLNKLIVATCDYQRVAIGPYSGGLLQTCSRILMSGMFMLNYHFQEENARLIPEMDGFLSLKLKEWRQNCSEKGKKKLFKS